ncbi:MAG: S49 family peptidase [Rhizobiales bacterium]|nr:S49 family peptidase [Hyphomicrobiales bacterium]
MIKFFKRILSGKKRAPVVAVLRLQGTIGAITPLRPGLTLQHVDPILEKAFAVKKAKAVALLINSPGGSPVQSAQIFHRIRQLAEEKDKSVLVFIEDVGASGGYMLALAGDEIYADVSSIVGSIGVVSAGFGFVDAIKKLGIERRVHTAGENKSILDPFLPSKKADVDRLKALQLEVHEAFKEMVRQRRGGKLDEDEKDLFSGAFWSGGQAKALGLVDDVGTMHAVLKAKFGDDLELKPISAPKKGLLSRLIPGASDERADAGMVLERMSAGLGDELISSLEARAVWARFGL